VPELHHACTIFVLTASGTSSRSFDRYAGESLGMGCLYADVAEYEDVAVTNNPCPYIDAELLLVWTAP
jgi:hypothetical protein